MSVSSILYGMITVSMTIQDFLLDIGIFINYTLIPFLFALALLFFVFNVARYFIIGANDPKKREQARQLALYGILAFVFLVSLWGIVNLVSRGLGIDYDRSMCPDYMDGWCGDSGDSYYDDTPFPTSRPNNYQLPQQGPDGGAF